MNTVSYKPLRYQLRRRGITEKELCKRLSFPSYAENMLCSDRLLPPSLLAEICAFLDCGITSVVEIAERAEEE